ncbi:MAG TPA: ABC transporter transmembrane domain-containing protein, partial [Spirochaetia bacterium]|nr:ABC transporter transmembrane domain-containing protein [Spirochaetia bacterium]
MSLSFLWRYLKPFVPAFLLGLILALAFNATVLAKPYLLKHLIDGPLTHPSSGPQAILLLALAYFFAVVLGAVLQYAQSVYLTAIGQKILHRLRMDLFDHVQRMSPSFFDRNSTGRLLTRLTND